ncbi:hypothetical protein BHM03_00044711 [Ensete ventricosum]|nr:hypothetical protein BHM03_00044711 [Ensete ventricosum]
MSLYFTTPSVVLAARRASCFLQLGRVDLAHFTCVKSARAGARAMIRARRSLGTDRTERGSGNAPTEQELGKWTGGVLYPGVDPTGARVIHFDPYSGGSNMGVNSGSSPCDLAEGANSGTNLRDLAERVNSDTNIRDLAERANSRTDLGDLAERANSGTNFGGLAERANSGTNL